MVSYSQRLRHTIKMKIWRQIDFLRGIFVNITSNPIFVFGNQKSGTTAISGLLSIMTQLPATLDIIPLQHKDLSNLQYGKISFNQFVRKYRYNFSKKIIKEPSLTFFYDEVKKYFSFEKSIFVVREPKDNIRSILNRLNIRGDLKELNNTRFLTPLWKQIIFNDWLGIQYNNYIESLAGRWQKAVDIYRENKNDFVLVKYEDFLKNKVKTIEKIAEEFSLPIKNDITSVVDKPFQPAGNSNINILEFFGENNLRKIERICKKGMQLLNYDTMSL